MTQRNLVMMCAACGLIGALACDGSDRDDAARASEPQDAGDAQWAPETSVGGGVPVAAMPAAAPPGRDMPGIPIGDTFAVPVCKGDGMAMSSVVSLDEAEAAGFDPRAELAQVEGAHQFVVRWTDSARTEPTTLTMELHGTGGVQLDAWVERSPGMYQEYPPCPGAWIRPVVEVRISTADHAVEGAFKGILYTHYRPPALPGEATWDIPYPWWTVAGDARGIQVEPGFKPSAEPKDLSVYVSALHGDEELGERGEISLLLQRLGPRSPSETAPTIEWRWALPLDGCSSLARPIDSASCDPWTKLERHFLDVHENDNECCANIGELVTYHDPASDDAGVQ